VMRPCSQVTWDQPHGSITRSPSSLRPMQTRRKQTTGASSSGSAKEDRYSHEPFWNAALITGIGFIGGGATLHDKGMVTGTATAASIWSIGIVGAAVAIGRYDIAVVLTLINLLTLKALAPLKRQLDEPDTSPRPQ